MKKRPVNLKVIAIFCIILFVLLTSCKGRENPVESVEKSEVQFPMSGHVLYGYKYGVTICGQYMDQAGDDNAMVLIFVEKEEGNTSEVLCKSVAINDVQVNSIIKTEIVTSKITAIDIQVSSAETEVDELQRESQVTIDFVIIDSVNGTIIDKPHPISFPCN